jgi:hypothetical protein
MEENYKSIARKIIEIKQVQIEKYNFDLPLKNSDKKF